MDLNLWILFLYGKCLLGEDPRTGMFHEVSAFFCFYVELLVFWLLLLFLFFIIFRELTF